MLTHALAHCSAAVELLPAGVPTGVVALTNIAPALLAKAVWPYALRGQVRYARRIAACALLSAVGMLVSAEVERANAEEDANRTCAVRAGLERCTALMEWYTHASVADPRPLSSSDIVQYSPRGSLASASPRSALGWAS